ncbi:peroxisomal membrane anchor protein conserved region-domain-containing protein [Aspergillus ambiguus]|uniref:putative peroxisomal membrane anchor protein (Pex14) n=1 Tax=Aspergillus ambiguus TaxID=176160 RepID=UPI003CCD4A34
MAREELVSSAVTFLQDPSVASSPIEKRVAFLQSKNLTKEEIELALSRVGEDPAVAAAAAAGSSSSGYQAPAQQAVYRPPPSPAQGYGYPPYGQWQPPPPEPPKRDWRDWFIMATVMGGVGYGLYFVTKRYISPLIAPPTPPQLEQDKQNIDEQFSRAFTLIEQLSTDTAALKSAEEARTERLDTALREVETLVADLKTASRRRDDETRRISDEVKSLKDAIPKALEGAREGNENRLKDLGNELKSLKTLLGNRLGGGSASSAPALGRTVGGTTLPTASKPAEESSPAASPATNGVAATPTTEKASQQPSVTDATPSSTPAAATPSTNPISQLNRSASIPAWQMAAANRSKTASPSTTSSTPAENSTSEQQSAPAS